MPSQKKNDSTVINDMQEMSDIKKHDLTEGDQDDDDYADDQDGDMTVTIAPQDYSDSVAKPY